MIERFMQELREQGYTQDRIAEMTGLTQAAISKLFRGATPNATTIVKLAITFHVSTDHILGLQ